MTLRGCLVLGLIAFFAPISFGTSFLPPIEVEELSTTEINEEQTTITLPEILSGKLAKASKWVPDQDNLVWKELNFPVEPQEALNDTISSTPSPLPPNFDKNDLNLTFSENRIAGGRLACRCGIPSGRIVNGELANINTIPWTVALVRKGGSFLNPFGGSSRPFCGGTLINDRYVLTASHCVDGQTERGISVLLNEQDFLISTETVGGTKKINVAKITMHANYNRRTVDNDIALLRLETPVDIFTTDSVLRPACLPANNDVDFTGIKATVAGWGTTSEGGSVSTSLRKVEVPIISNSDCNTKTKYKNKISAGMMCAGFIDSGGKDSCQGDSGGPLIIDNGQRKTLVGVVSWGFGCAKPQAPGVYTRVAKYPDWILANTKDANWCSE